MAPIDPIAKFFAKLCNGILNQHNEIAVQAFLSVLFEQGPQSQNTYFELIIANENHKNNLKNILIESNFLDNEVIKNLRTEIILLDEVIKEVEIIKSRNDYSSNYSNLYNDLQATINNKKTNLNLLNNAIINKNNSKIDQALSFMLNYLKELETKYSEQIDISLYVNTELETTIKAMARNEDLYKDFEKWHLLLTMMLPHYQCHFPESTPNSNLNHGP